MSKHPNPVRGHVLCPVCDSAATVHRVGEGKLIAEGEPTKNSRNMGLLYYKCPSCGNSPMSKSINAFVENNMVDTVEALISTEPATIDAPASTVEQSAPTVESPDLPSLATIEATQVVTVESEPAEVVTPVKKAPFPVKKVLAIAGIVALLILAIRQLLPSKKPTETEGATVNG